MRATAFSLAVLAMVSLPGLGTAQATPRDSAKRLAQAADSAYAGGSAEQLRRARDLRASALALVQRAGDRELESEILIGLGDALLDLGEQDSALATYQRALGVARELQSRPQEARVLNQIGLTLHQLGRSDSVLFYHRTALAIQRELGDSAGELESLVNIGALFLARGMLDTALAYDYLALRLGPAADRKVYGTLLSNTGLVYHQRGRLDSARAYYLRALPIRREVGDGVGEGTTLNTLGGTFADVGEADSALSYFRRALARRREVGDRRGQATTLDNIGLSLATLGRVDSALVYHRQALALAREVKDRRIEGYVLPSIANAFGNLGMTDSAIAYNLAAVAMMREAGYRLYEASALNNVGGLYFRLADTASALRYWEQSLALAREIGDRRVQARPLDDLGSLQRMQGRPDSALRLHQEALTVSRGVNDRIMETRILANIARVYDRTSRRDLGRAVAYYDSAAAVRSFTVRRAGSDANRVSFQERYVGLFAEWTLAWLARSGEIGAEPAALGGLTASERGRSQALLNLMRRGSSTGPAGADFVAEGKSLTRWLRRGHEAALVYQATGDTLLIWTIGTQGEVHLVRVRVPYDSLVALVRDLRALLGSDGSGRLLDARGASLEAAEVLGAPSPTSAWSRRASDLTAVVLPPEVLKRLAGAREIVVVPHGALGMISFAALPAGPSGEPLGATVALRYAPSLGTLSAAEEREGLPSGAARTAALRSALVVGNPSMPTVTTTAGERSLLTVLPGAEAEGLATARRLGASSLVGTDATEGAVRRRLSTASLVHLATHGFAYQGEMKVRQSFVALAADSTSDGLLTVGEILDDPTITLSAELVVLSACQTGLGDLKQAEGTVGFQRAFLAKGARTVLVSLWNVSDQATRLLMERFYRHWLDDGDQPTKSEALRRAQGDARRTPGFEHPRFWAGFQLVGAR